MDEPSGAEGLVDVETALQREIDTLTQRFPDLDRAKIDAEVHETYSELESHATIHSHLVTVTAHHVGDVLRERGEHFQPRSAPTPDSGA